MGAEISTLATEHATLDDALKTDAVSNSRYLITNAEPDLTPSKILNRFEAVVPHLSFQSKINLRRLQLRGRVGECNGAGARVRQTLLPAGLASSQTEVPNSTGFALDSSIPGCSVITLQPGSSPTAAALPSSPSTSKKRAFSLEKLELCGMPFPKYVRLHYN